MHLHPIKILRSLTDPISVSFPVNPRPDGALPVNRPNKSPIDATCALIGRALVLMTLNPFERDVVSLKLVSMLLQCSSPPASLVFDVFFMRTNSQKTFENGIWVVREIWFLSAEFSQPVYYFSINPNIWQFVLTYREWFKFDSVSLYCGHISFWFIFLCTPVNPSSRVPSGVPPTSSTNFLSLY